MRRHRVAALDGRYQPHRRQRIRAYAMKEPVDHILRPRLPWRADQPLTECGYNANSVKTLTREQFEARLKEYGQQRAGLLTCMTCMSTAQNWPTWQEDPRLAVQREIQWEAVHWNHRTKQVYQYASDRKHYLLNELLTIEALIAAHPEEFAKLLQDRIARQQWLEDKAKPRAKQSRPDKGGGPKWRPV
jgi:hypothetical protein